jgi:hypothetical protein
VVITVFSNPEVTIPARVTQSYEAEFQQLFNAVVSQAEKGEL